MKIRKLFSLLLAVILLVTAALPCGVINTKLEELTFVPDAHAAEVDLEYYVNTFIISAYYSPLPGQEYYVTGSYEGDIYLNGNGTNGADGTEVYPGMIAAPPSYAFGTKMDIPGIGIGAVHDRGGAIKEAGVRGDAYDRLDIWMGHGDVGLRRALNWGKRTVETKVYGADSGIEENIYLEGFSAAESFLTSTVLSPLEFQHDLYYGTEGEEVGEMQQYLKDWNYYEDEVTGFYGNETAQALFQFQLDFDLVDSPYDLGAGHFGIGTRTKFDNLITAEEAADEILQVQKGENLMTKYVDLYEEKVLFSSPLQRGNSNEDVRLLQEELVKLGFMRIEPNGYFGEVTEHAVYKFQQSQGLVAAKDDTGSGYVGPATRAALNDLIEVRYEAKSIFAYQREEIDSGRFAVKMPESFLARLKEEE
jgi:peptidoglycan hydrolase-like protein with peptidoglycan-binding domain/3D (Asp-Asp-Asp) domain-containing protein